MPDAVDTWLPPAPKLTICYLFKIPSAIVAKIMNVDRKKTIYKSFSLLSYDLGYMEEELRLENIK